MFWFKKNKKIVVEAYTNDALVEKYFKLKPASSFVHQASVLPNKGFVLPIWYDFESFIKGNFLKEFLYTFHQNYNLLPQHDYNLDMHFSDNLLFNIPTPWRIYTEEPLEWLVTQSTRFQEYVIPFKTQNFCFNHVLNLEMLVPNTEQVLNIPVNTPLVNLIPLTEKEVVFNFHYDLDTSIQLEMRSESIAFTGGEYVKRSLYERWRDE